MSQINHNKSRIWSNTVEEIPLTNEKIYIEIYISTNIKTFKTIKLYEN